MLPVDITRSQYKCSLEDLKVRLGFNYVRALRAQTALRIVEERDQQPFTDIDDLARRVPGIRKDELAILAEVGALNTLDAHHRRDGLWKATRAGRPVGPLLEQVPESTPESPLLPMNREERLHADYRGTSLTIGPHPMAFHREEMQRLGVTCAVDLTNVPPGRWTKVAGNAVVKQRPGTAKGIVFISLEDETGISNVVVIPDLFTGPSLDHSRNIMVPV